MKDQKMFKQFITLVSEKYQVEVSQIMAKLIWNSLSPYDDQACSAAFGSVIRKGRFYKDLLPDLMDFLESNDDQALTAWMKFQDVLTGSKRIEQLEDPIATRVYNVLGPHRLSLITEKEVPFIQREFEREYKLLKKKATEVEALPMGNDKVVKLVNKSTRAMPQKCQLN